MYTIPVYSIGTINVRYTSIYKTLLQSFHNVSVAKSTEFLKNGGR